MTAIITDTDTAADKAYTLLSRRPVALIMFIGPPDRNAAISRLESRVRERERGKELTEVEKSSW